MDVAIARSAPLAPRSSYSVSASPRGAATRLMMLIVPGIAAFLAAPPHACAEIETMPIYVTSAELPKAATEPDPWMVLGAVLLVMSFLVLTFRRLGIGQAS